MSLVKRLCGIAAAGLLLAPGIVAAAQPVPWQIDFQPAASPVMENLRVFNIIISSMVYSVAAFILALMAYVVWRFNAKRHPVPSKTSHNTVLELIWTAVPIVILVVIAIPSFKLLYFMDKPVDAEMTIKAIGQQFSWSYEYPDHGNFAFDANLVPEEELKPGQPRLLETDTHVVLPVDTTIRILVASNDVIHSWAVPAFGVKLDAVPGRLGETWVRIDREGTYYGQCSELCGSLHGFMPITVEAVSKEAFADWVEKAKIEFARDVAPAPATVARAVLDDALHGERMPK